MKFVVALMLITGFAVGVEVPILLGVLALILVYYCVNPYPRISRQLRSLQKYGYTASHFFLPTTPSPKAPVRGLAVDERGRVALHSGGKWEGVELLDVVIMPHEDVTVHTTGSRSLFGAVLGGLVAGPVGAIVGGTGRATQSKETRSLRSIDLVLTVNSLENPIRVVSFNRDLDGAKQWYGRLLASQSLARHLSAH